jgi:putative flippase GtrA
MSAALQSLMREAPRSAQPSLPLWGGILNFVGIGASGALTFVLLSTAIIGLNTGVPAWIVNVVCYAALIGPIYLLQRRFSFQSDAPHIQALPRYVAVQCMALALAAVFSYVVHGTMNLPTVVASLLVIGLTSGVNFVVLRSWAFARTNLMAAA